MQARRHRWFFAAACVAWFICLGAVFGQTRLAVKASPPDVSEPLRFDMLSRPEHKLTPDLQAVVASRSKLIGLTKDGRAVLEFPVGVNSEAARVALREGPRGIEIRVIRDEAFEKLDKLIVVYSGDQPPRELKGGLRIQSVHESGHFVVVQSEAGFTAEQIETLAADRAVRLVQPNYLYRLFEHRRRRAARAVRSACAVLTASGGQVPNDPEFNKQWGMENIHATAAWSKGHDASVLVAVIDTGIDFAHEDLQANVLKGLSKDFTTDNDPAAASRSHGTHCTGIIGAVGNNQKGVAGVCWKAQIMVVKIFSKTGTYAGDIEATDGINYAVDKGAKVLSNSWGGEGVSPIVKAAIDRAESKGVLFVAAAGNDGTDNDDLKTRIYPASFQCKNIIAVLSIEKDDTISSFSCFGQRTVDIGAPGGDIYSTFLGSNYGPDSGTSMAAPHVAGAAALLWSQPKYQKLSHLQVKSLLLQNARALPTLTTKCVTGGTLDLSFLGH